MSEEKPEGAVALLLREHAPVLGRVAMALLGDATHVERVLEQVARDASANKSSGSPPPNVKPLAWLLGLVRTASATHLSKLPMRTRSMGMGMRGDTAPTTERIGAGDAIPARAALAALKPTEREAVVLCLVGGLEATDVAVACSIDIGTAKTRIARGVEQLLASQKQEEGQR
jgi:DNA-directed RNA polymerase specialized sigma24 family protein